ncbi:MAG: Gfo/Idh/MocA family oxidoreductase [Bacteroidota bacterium]
MKKLRFGVIGAGFWSQFQIPGWLESDQVELVAVCDQDLKRAQSATDRFGGNAYGDARKMIANEKLDFVDIITNVESHLAFAKLVAENGVQVVCQKPLADSLAAATELVDTCQHHGVRLFANENFRWQAPLREVKRLMTDQAVGAIFKARVSFCSAFPVFDNQPHLGLIDRFIMTDIGSHIFDICRFLMGEVDTLYCQIQRVNEGIQGEDVANALMKMESGAHCLAEMSYASILEREAFPETLVFLEGDQGSIALLHDRTIKISTSAGTTTQQVPVKSYPWADPDYDLIHSSIVETQKDILRGLQGGQAETTGGDNLETVRLVWAAYHSAENNRLVNVKDFGR